VKQDAAALRADPRRMAEMFGRIAPRYDLMNRLMTGGLDRRWRRLAAGQVHVAPGRRVLDACCGTGDLALAIAEASPGAAVVGIDLSAPMLRLAAWKAAAAGILGEPEERDVGGPGESDKSAIGAPEEPDAGPQAGQATAPAGRSTVRFRQADLLDLPYDDDAFDAAAVAFGVRNVADLTAALREMARVVRPGGRLACLEITPPPPGLGERFHRQWFDRAVPLLGRFVAGDAAAYSYLPDSVRSFPRPEELCRLLCATGWESIRHRRLGFGIVALHVAECKPSVAPEDAHRSSEQGAAPAEPADGPVAHAHTSTRSEFAWSSPAQRRRVGGAMRRVEAKLEEVATAYPGELGASARTTLEAGGKRLRPLLVILCCRADAPLPRHAVRAAAAVELLHMATLVHDDVLDAAKLRRGRPTVVSSHGAHMATSVGNYLFAGAFAEVVATGSSRAVARLSEAAAGLSRGELLQMNEAFRTSITAEEYLRRCELKTGGLFGAACALGAVVSGLSEAAATALDRFGRCLGLAFQIFDDILDFSGEAEETGKHPGTDVRDGTVTLPLILAMEEAPELADIVGRPAKSTAEVDQVVNRVRAGDALERAREMALAHIGQARGLLSTVDPAVEHDLLDQLAGRVVDRYS